MMLLVGNVERGQLQLSTCNDQSDAVELVSMPLLALQIAANSMGSPANKADNCVWMST